MTLITTTSFPATHILIINPNTSENMTAALKPVISGMGYEAQNVKFSYFTCPSPGIPSINSPDDAAESAKACIPHLRPLLSQYDAFLVACYSHHPLVQQIRTECDALSTSSSSSSSTSTTKMTKHVTGIFESSVTASLLLAGTHGTSAGFGIVSTGKIWETALADAVTWFLHGGDNSFTRTRFLGCETTGLNASELHELPPAKVQGKMMDATQKLVERATQQNMSLAAVCLGCAGMVGLEEAVRKALTEKLGEEAGAKVGIIDGVKVGVGQLVTLVNARC